MFYVLIVIVVVVAVFLVLGLTGPATFSIAREAEYRATPAALYGQLNDFHNWAAWSPWEKMDPAMQRTYSGPSSGVGSKYAWVGNKKVGQGNMEITHSEPNMAVQLDLHFLKPFQADNVTAFTLLPKGDLTTLKWEMRGQKPFFIRMMRLFMDMDKMVGKDFENGLANLRGVVEK